MAYQLTHKSGSLHFIQVSAFTHGSTLNLSFLLICIEADSRDVSRLETITQVWNWMEFPALDVDPQTTGTTWGGKQQMGALFRFIFVYFFSCFTHLNNNINNKDSFLPKIIPFCWKSVTETRKEIVSILLDLVIYLKVQIKRKMQGLFCK